MTKRQFLAIMYLLTGVIPLIAQTFTEQKKSYPVSADGNKYVVSGFTPFSSMQERTSTLMHCYGPSKMSVRSYGKGSQR